MVRVDGEDFDFMLLDHVNDPSGWLIVLHGLEEFPASGTFKPPRFQLA